MTTDLLSAEREYVEKAVRDVQAGGHFARHDLTRLNALARVISEAARSTDFAIRDLHCATPDLPPGYTIKAALAEALEPFMSAEAYRVFSAAVEGK